MSYRGRIRGRNRNKELACRNRRLIQLRRLPLVLERLEDRTLLSVEPITLADSSLYGASANGASSLPSISADGQLVAFQSSADNIVPNDTNAASDVFVYNRSTGQTTLVSVNASGTGSGDRGSSNPVISPDGRYIAFDSSATDLVPGFVAHGIFDNVFVRDLQTGTTSLVSVNNSNDGIDSGNGRCFFARFSADSHHIVLESVATDLVKGVGFPFGTNLFERDLVAGTTQLVTVDRTGTQGTSLASDNFSVSADGRFVAFLDGSENLVNNDSNGIEDVFVRDLVAGTTSLVTVDTTGTTSANQHSNLTSQALSADGRYVVFQSFATNLVNVNLNFHSGLFIRDLRTGITSLISISADGTHNSGGFAPVISADGRYVGFISGSIDLVTGLTKNNGANNDVFVRDLRTGTTQLVSINAAGTGTGNDSSGTSQYPYDFSPGEVVFSADDRYLAFASQASDLVANVPDGNNSQTSNDNRRDVFVRDLQAQTTQLISINATGTAGGDSGSFTPAMSANGQVIASESVADDLAAGDHNRSQDIFVRDLGANTTSLASTRSPLLRAAYPASGGGTLASVTPDGRFVAFTSYAAAVSGFSDLTPSVPTWFGWTNAYVRDRQTGTVVNASVLPDGTARQGTASNLRLSADGRYLVFQENSPNQLDASVPSVSRVDVYARDLQVNVTHLVSVNSGGTAGGNSNSGQEVAVSADGRYIAFTSDASDLVAGMTNSHQGVYLRDTQLNQTYLVSVNTAGTGSGNANSYEISISADGRYVLFVSDASDLVPGDTNNAADVFRWDRTSGQVSLVSVNQAGTGPGNKDSGDNSFQPAMTSDGRFVAFGSNATDLVSNDPNNHGDIFLRDMTLGTTALVSFNTSQALGGNSSSSDPALSSDGRYVAFLSNSSDLVSNDTNGQQDVFVRNMQGGISLVSINSGGTDSGNNYSGPLSQGIGVPRISADGRYVAFTSRATNLAAGFVDGSGGSGNLFVRDLQAGTTKPITVNASGTAGGNDSTGSDSGYLLSADGSTVFFDNGSSDLFPGDRNYSSDIFAAAVPGTSTISGQVFQDSNNNGVHDAGEPGLQFWTVFLDSDGNGQLDSGETSVITDSAGRYAFTGLTPGTYTIAIVPETGYQQTLPVSPAAYSVTISTDGSTVTGKDFGELLPLPDLAAQSVAFSSASVGVGQPLTITWSVTNQGTGAAAGSWQDGVYLSTTPTLSADSQLVAVVPHSGGLGVGQSYPGSVTVNVPPVAAGNYYIVVQTDRRDQVFEGPFNTNKVNNVAASGSMLPVSLPALIPGTPVQDQFTAAGQERFYQINVGPGQSLQLALTSAGTDGANELYVRRGDYPTPSAFDFAGRTAGQPSQSVTVPTTQGGTYYILVLTLYGTASTSAFMLTAGLPGFGIQSIAGNSGGNTGRVTIAIQGSLLTPNTQASLVSGSTILPAAALFFQDASVVYATFDLTGQVPGTYDVRLTDSSQTATLPSAFSVVAGQTSAVQVFLTPTQVVRVGRQAGVVVEYVNPGNVDAMAPLLQLTADNAVLRLPAQSTFGGNSVQFLGVSTDGPAGTLRPGEHGRITIPFQSTGAVGQDIHFTLQTADDSQTIDLSSQEDALRPSFIPAEAWSPILANLTANLGATVASYHTVLADDATYLSQLGETTGDVSRLFAFEIEKANAAYTSQTLASSLDASMPTPGLALTFQRQFLQPIAGRYHLGTLGRGWTSNWDVTASTDARGNITINKSGSLRFFAGQADGSFQAGKGDHAILTLVNGAYQLRELDGTITAFNPDGTLNYVQNANGNRITAAYTSGLLTMLTHSNGALLTLTYANGLLTQVQDSAGRTSTYDYDSANQHLVGYTDKYGQTTYTYVTGQGPPSENALATISFSDNTHVFFSYDSQGRLQNQHRDNNQEGLTFTYGVAGGVTTTDANNAQSTVLKDDDGMVGQTIDSLGHVTQFRYDDSMNLTQLLGPLGTKYVYAYDALGDVVSSTDPLGLTVSFTYGNNGQLLGYQDARGNKTSYRYDGNGNLMAIAYPDNSLEQFSYDPTGNPIQMINRRGHAIGYQYNAAGQLTETDFADGTKQTYTYDSLGHGNLVKASDAAGDIVLAYTDPQNPDLVTKITYPDGKFLAFTYNSVGQRTQSVDQGSFTINYIYDALGRLQQLTDGTGALIVQYNYDLAGRLSQKDMGNGTRTTYQYDAADNLLQLVNLAPDHVTVNSEYDYAYDDLGRRTSMTTGGVKTTYGYDADGQLTSIDTTGLSIQYVYDADGNRVTEMVNGVTTNYTANNLNQYTAVGGTTYQYDADGNLIQKNDGSGTTTYTFNDENRLAGVSGPGLTAAYTYDPLGNRNSETINGATTHFLIDPFGLGNVASEYNSAGSVIAHYTIGLGLTSRVDAGGTAAYYDFDGTGNTAGITDVAGSYLDRYTYQAFGKTTTLAASLANAFTFGGRFGLMNDGSGLVSMRFRDYDAATGQFVSDDPLGSVAGDTNIRRYVGNDPLSYIDPLGLQWGNQAGRKSCGFADYSKKPQKRQQPPLVKGNYPIANAKNNKLQAAAAGGAAGAGLTLIIIGGYAIAGSPLSGGVSGLVGLGLISLGAAIGYLAGDAPNASSGVGGVASSSLSASECSCMCDQPPPGAPPRVAGKPGPSGSTQVVSGFDPNDLIGPAGFGTSNWIQPQPTLPYTIDFENDPAKATAPAQDVTVTETLDPNLDWNTFALGSMQFGATVVSVPVGLQSFHTVVHTTNTDGTPLDVDIAAALNLQTGVVTWTFSSLDPATGQLPGNPFAGFLPPDDASHRGQGLVTYTVQPKANLTTGTAITAQASIVFDTNAALATNTASNTIDNGPPTSAIQPLPAIENTTSFTVSWSGSDDAGGSGIASFDVFVSDNGGPFTTLLTATTQTSTTFTGQFGHAYGFYSVATDNVGNVQPTPAGAQANTFVFQPATISGTVLQDINVDGVQESGEPGIGGQTLFLDLNGSGTLAAGDPTATTDANGNFQFTVDTPGTYTLREILLGGVLLDGPVSGSYSVTLTSGANVSGENFADVPTSIAVPLTLPLTGPFPKQGNANADFVEAVYRAVLDRDAEPGGLATWTNALNSGSLTRLQVVQGIRQSPEHFTQEVTDFYFTLLNRAPDPTGLQSWVQALESGSLTEEQAAFNFLNSAEYLGKGDKYFVDHMYLSLLGRTFDTAGEGHWLDALGDDPSGNPTHPASVTHQQVIINFLYSPESLNRLVEGYYQVFLQRLADSFGLNSWLSALQNGGSFLTIGQYFLSSDEFYNRAAAQG